MQLADFLREDLVLLNLQARTKPALFREMADHFRHRGYLSQTDAVVERLLEREQLMSTGIKRGFAIPHAFTHQLDTSLMLVGISHEGIDFQALDHEPVSFVFLLLGPPGNQGVHMRALACLSRVLGSDGLYGRLEAAKGEREILDVLLGAERETSPAASR